jgi:hypothetical protein
LCVVVVPIGVRVTTRNWSGFTGFLGFANMMVSSPETPQTPTRLVCRADVCDDHSEEDVWVLYPFIWPGSAGSLGLELLLLGFV